MSSEKRGFDVLADALIENEASPVFGLLGDANLAPVARAVQRGAQFFSCRNEMASVSMAAGYSIATGKPGFATVTRGPGFTNSLTGLISAVRDRVPIVFLVGDTTVGDRWSPQNIDHAVLTATTGAEFIHCTGGEMLAASVTRAKQLALALDRPVVLDIPANLFDAPAVPQQEVRASAGTSPVPAVPQPDPESVREAAQSLKAAARPLIVAGRGAVAAQAGPKLVKLARATGALLATTLPAAGLFAGEEWSIGIAGGLGLEPTRRLMGQADVVLGVGTTFNNYITLGGKLFTDSTVIHCDRDPAAIGQQHRADIGIVGDALAATEMLLKAALEGPRLDEGFRTQDVGRTIADGLESPHWSDESMPGAVDPRTFLRAFEEALPGDRRYFIDNGHFLSFPCQVLRPRFPGQLVPCLGFGAVGLAVPTAVGAAIGRPDETTVAIVGDGGLLMSMTEMETVARLSPSLVIVVLNDSSYRAEVHHLHRHGLPSDLAEFPRTDFASIARSYGITAITVTDAGELEHLGEHLGAGNRPLVLDVHVNPLVIAEKFQVALARAKAGNR